MQRLHGALRTMVRIRWVAVGFCIVQIFTFYQPYPDGVLAVALGLTALLAVGNGLVGIALPRISDLPAARRAALASLGLDLVVVMGLVFVYTFDAETAMFTIVYLLPLEAAILFQLRGALGVMGVATAIYIAREAYGTAAFGHDFLVASITFRMGVGWLIAAVAGAMASSLLRERDRLAAASADLESHAAELAAANRELQAASELKDDFVAMTNHELRTPLTTILGYTSTLEQRWDGIDDARRREFVRQIDLQGRRLLHLVEGLLTISSAQAGALPVTLQPVRLRRELDAVLNGYGEHEIEVTCDPQLRVMADPVRLHQVLLNLLTNARKYGEPPVLIAAERRGDWVELRVRDHGPGVPADFVPHLFEKFTQASRGDSRSAEGTGLGLAIVRQLVEAQGGEVDLEPAAGPGACFRVRLPVGDGDSEPG